MGIGECGSINHLSELHDRINSTIAAAGLRIQIYSLVQANIDYNYR